MKRILRIIAVCTLTVAAAGTTVSANLPRITPLDTTWGSSVTDDTTWGITLPADATSSGEGSVDLEGGIGTDDTTWG